MRQRAAFPPTPARRSGNARPARRAKPAVMHSGENLWGLSSMRWTIAVTLRHPDIGREPETFTLELC